MLPRYNIALLPTQAAINQAFYKSAKILQPYANGYCLNPENALPHVTVSQFRAKDDAEAIKIFQSLVGKEITVNNSGIYITDGTLQYSGKIWTGFIVNREKTLMDFQEKVVAAISQPDIEVLNTTRDGYFPHFTLALFTTLPPSLPTGFYDHALINTPIPCRPCLGASDENGQFLRILAQ